MGEMKKKIGVLHELERVRNAIRQKHKQLKVARMELGRATSETFKPIVQPLERLIDVTMVAPSAATQWQQRRRRRRQLIDDKASIKKQLFKTEMQQQQQQQQQEDSDGGGESSDTSSSASSADTVVADPNYEEETAAAADPILSEKKPQRSVEDYTKMLQINDIKSLDTKIGVRIAYNKLMMGNQPIEFDGNKIMVGDLEFDETPGLIELLFEKSPDMNRFTPEDEANFVKIVLSTHAHRASFKPTTTHRIDNEKYIRFIEKPEKEIFLRQQQAELKEKERLEQAKRKVAAAAAEKDERKFFESLKQSKKNHKKGGGILPYKIVQKRASKMDYVYWDDPNELVDRLQLLYAESAAGNASHVNEISSIVEELREAGIIY